MDYKPEEMDHEPQETSPLPAETLSEKALSTLRVMAFLDRKHLHEDLFEPLRQVFLRQNEELWLDFPVTGDACTAACDELVEASLIQLSDDGKTYSISPTTQMDVLTATQALGLLIPLFKTIVKVLTVMWPEMVSISDRRVDQRESQISQIEEYCKYARVSPWGGRNQLVCHVVRLANVFNQLTSDMKACIADTDDFAQLLAEAAWYYLERSRYLDAQSGIQAALKVYECTKRKSPFLEAILHRVRAAIAIERGDSDAVARHVRWQLKSLGVYRTSQGRALKNSGLLDRAPDGVALSPWGLDVPQGIIVTPFRSLFNFGWKLYSQYMSSPDNKRDAVFAVRCLRYAARCFSTVGVSRERAHTGPGQITTRTGELCYALGNITTELAYFHGQALLGESLEHYEKALEQFQAAVDDSHSAAGIAKTRYKLAINFIGSRDLRRAAEHLEEAARFYFSDSAYDPHLARVLFHQSRIQAMTRNWNARSTSNNAFAIRGRTRPGETRRAEELSEADYDELIGIWER